MTGLFKILIVDDDDDYRETYKMLLARKGYNIETACSAEEASPDNGKRVLSTNNQRHNDAW